ncbi:DUF2946 family protein [Undibacterium crateris]|uniref:DUF2946 family protein n=1 Tax=Undibacterium crateris TaxID=2528175 RepID=UPI0013893B81|nr:DUF2946 family protein [Undibacterium crateris]NDI87147.1 DUF2946 domain-containing protein [Undibacterium crateris]
MSRLSMSPRLFHRLVRAVLMFYVLTLGVAMAATLAKTETGSLICTSTGYKMISVKGEPDSGRSNSHILDCPLCVASGLPPTVLDTSDWQAPHALSYATQSIPAARLAAIVSAPLPARGPPSDL